MSDLLMPNQKCPAGSYPMHGGDRRTAGQLAGLSPADLIDFSANIMPFGISDTIRQAILTGIDDCCHYPDPHQHELRSLLAARHGLNPAQVACGNGAADVLYRAIQVIRPRRVFLPVPTFLEYAKACREQHARIVPYWLPGSSGLRVTDDLLCWLDAQSCGGDAGGPKRPDLLILCNPNNPTGLLIEPQVLRRLADFCEKNGTWLLVDECFLDFVEQEDMHSLMFMLRRPAGAERLMILRSMTKFFAIPGLRLGYLCANQTVADAVRAMGQPWTVSTLAAAAGQAAILDLAREEQTVSQNRRRWLVSERDRLSAALRERGWTVWPGSANFLFFQAAGETDLVGTLLRKRLLIRSCANYPGLGPDYYRIAVRTAAENQYLIDALPGG